MAPRTERTAQAFLTDSLRGTRFAKVTWVTETGSTNDDLIALAQQGAPEQVLIADEQTAGRGRRGRTWVAPPGTGLLMSVLIRNVIPSDGFWAVGAVALAASEAIGDLTTSPCSLKWPNDVLLGPPTAQRKVAGVLSQIADDALVVGIGINTTWPDEVPDEVGERGTAINRHTASETNVDRGALAAAVLQGAMRHLASERPVLHDAWQARCSTLGQHVRLEMVDGAIVGFATGIAPDGVLQIEVNGVTTSYQVGDVVHLRPAN